ncbi:polysaccharide deacetylase family protein [Roseibium aggregatum]|nr:polysaccharide deacetylase family protein [Roseibium aggregatum]
MAAGLGPQEPILCICPPDKSQQKLGAKPDCAVNRQATRTCTNYFNFPASRIWRSVRKGGEKMLAKTQVLTFHGIGVPAVPVSPEESHYFVPIETYQRTIERLPALEQKHGVKLEITFDDGNLSDYEVGLPALVEAGRPGRFFVLAARIGAKGYLTAEQMREIVSSGSVIGSHGHDHVDWRKLDAAGFQRELYDARKKIEDAVGAAVTEAAIPFGALDANVLHRLKEAGYGRVFTSTPGLAYQTAWFCPRFSPANGFDPDRDIPPMFSAKKRLKSSLYAFARRAKFRI